MKSKVQRLADSWMISIFMRSLKDDFGIRYTREEIHEALDLILDGKAKLEMRYNE